MRDTPAVEGDRGENNVEVGDTRPGAWDPLLTPQPVEVAGKFRLSDLSLPDQLGDLPLIARDGKDVPAHQFLKTPQAEDL